VQLKSRSVRFLVVLFSLSRELHGQYLEMCHNIFNHSCLYSTELNHPLVSVVTKETSAHYVPKKELSSQHTYFQS
jgi:hypothetical protein